MKTTHPPQPQNPEDSQISELQDQINVLQEQLILAQEKERRAFADYQNLIRRTQEEKSKLIRMAGASVIESILQPLDHLSMASAQINDPGLNMVVDQLQKALAEHGLEEIEVLGKDFDLNTMEVVEDKSSDSSDVKAKKVVSVVKKGYRLNGEIIAHAKVILG